MRRVIKWTLEFAKSWDVRFSLLSAGGTPSRRDRMMGATSMTKGHSFPESQGLSDSLRGRARREEGATKAVGLVNLVSCTIPPRPARARECLELRRREAMENHQSTE